MVGEKFLDSLSLPTRESTITRGIRECLVALYNAAQPSVDYEKLIAEIVAMSQEERKADQRDNGPVCDRYYLPEDVAMTIIQAYKDAYRCVNEWKENIEFVIDKLENAGCRIIYVKNDDGVGSHKDVERTKPLKDLIGKDHADTAISMINEFMHFYKFDSDCDKLEIPCVLSSPSANKETVERYWRSHGMPDFTVDDSKYSEEYDEA